MHGHHRPILVIYDRGRVVALDNRCPHMGFSLERGSVEDGILTCHWHHARFAVESGCTFDLWADDVPVYLVEVRDGEVWVKTEFAHADPALHWKQRLADGLAHDLSLVIAKAVQGQLAAEVARADVVRQIALFGARNRDGWGVGLTILTALANLLPVLPEEEVAYLALFHGGRHVAADCDGAVPRRERAALGSQPDAAVLKLWLGYSCGHQAVPLPVRTFDPSRGGARHVRGQVRAARGHAGGLLEDARYASPLRRAAQDAARCRLRACDTAKSSLITPISGFPLFTAQVRSWAPASKEGGWSQS
ncbi:Rieske 2Fe-2S domain-containing protein [Methylobacterium isbiliense]|nr:MULTISPECIES: Rieske 2Fe-2S domain-containing protein [Methylobacterium]MDN3626770.1 Rieske 2Fe-2S domain-containing protein [Methylobacterium isbiliense]